MRPSLLHRALAAWALLVVVRPVVAADDTVAILVLKEHGVGNRALAQPYLDRMVAITAKQNGWKDATGKYFTSRSAAEAFIKSAQPHLRHSLDALVSRHAQPYKLDVIGASPNIWRAAGAIS